jgi:hypothetical protein
LNAAPTLPVDSTRFLSVPKQTRFDRGRALNLPPLVPLLEILDDIFITRLEIVALH